jgi:hypothetical protein
MLNLSMTRAQSRRLGWPFFLSYCPSQSLRWTTKIRPYATWREDPILAPMSELLESGIEMEP